MKSAHTASSHSKKRLPVIQIVLGVVVLVLISVALAAGKYLSQGDTDTRSQAAGGAVCRTRKESTSEGYCKRDLPTGDAWYWHTCLGSPCSDNNQYICGVWTDEIFITQGCYNNETGQVTLETCNYGTTPSYCTGVRTRNFCNISGNIVNATCRLDEYCSNGTCVPASGSGGSGNSGGSGSTSNTSRTIVGQVKCTNVAGMTAPLNQPYAIPNVPVRTFKGWSAVSTNVIGSATTNAQGIFSMSLTSTDPKFTVRISNNNQDHDYAFYRKKPNALTGVTCYDTNAYELCDYLNIAAGTTKAGFDFETNVRAENLRGYQSGTNFVFEFKQARDYTNKIINRYVVRLDNKTDGWYNAASDYYLTVPRTDASGIGTCSGGVCKITSAELNAIKTFKFGTYGMGVNPIWNSHKAGQSPVIELCRNDATIQAQVSQTGTPPLPPCGSGLNCAGNQVPGSTACRTDNANTTAYCCPVNYTLTNGRCTAPPMP